MTPTDARPIERATLSATFALPAERLSRFAPVALGGLAAVLYLVGLTVSGYANTYYALAAQAGSQSWPALFFGALDSSGFITIDKPPLSTWLMALSVKSLGLSPLAVLLPQALLGIGTVVLLYATVRRAFGTVAGIVAGVAMALTPVAVLIFRYDNPDALLTFLLVASAWAMAHGLEDGRTRWAVLAGAIVGAAFLTKYLQAWIVLPGYALVWLALAPGGVRRRIGGLLAAGLAVLVSSGWWVAIVELIPATSRPYIGGSETNSALELLLGYDGLGRIFGGRDTGLGSALDGLGSVIGAPTGARGGPTFGGDPGILRLFNDQFAGDIAWLLPAAVLALVAGLVMHRRAARADRGLAAYAIWGSWLVTHVAVFSLMSGIIHPYYSVAIAPAIAALVGAGAVDLWRHRETTRWAGPVLAAGVALSAVTAFGILDRTPAFAPGLGFAIVALGAAAGLIVAVPPAQLDPRVGRAAVAVAVTAVLAGPFSYSVATMTTAHSGGDPSAGPNALGVFDGGGPGGGGPSGELSVDQALIDYLVEHRAGARWIVAVNGSQEAAGIQLAAEQPVMAMGGFTGGDPTPTLAQLEEYVSSGQLRYVLSGRGFGGDGFGGGPGGFRRSAEISTWLRSTCTVLAVPGTTSGATLYDCGSSAATPAAATGDAG